MYDFSGRLRNTTISEDNRNERLRSRYVVVFTCTTLKHHTRNVRTSVSLLPGNESPLLCE